ncbi:uncharacterized protein [Hetaerina americana]|uniref:uncharacterized protein n=1 Tax=Hetaerina americana TaxID=62018 RepID=UPI003A7F51FD
MTQRGHPCRRAWPPLVIFACLLRFAPMSEALLASSKLGGSYSLLRKPRLVLRHSTQDVGAFLEFFNADTLSIYGELENAVNCTVEGGHLLEVNGILQRITNVSIQSSLLSETWKAPKEMGIGDSDVLQTKTTFNISYNVEGNLTCRDTVGAGLVSNTLLLRFRNRESVIVALRGDSNRNASENYKVLRQVHKDYAQVTYLKQEARLVELKHLPEPEAVLRVSYYSESGVFDQSKVYTAVKEATKYITKENKLQRKYIRGTRYCPSVEEGNFAWPMTLAGSTVVPENPCIDGNETPQPRRACLGDFFKGVYWDGLPQRPHLCLDTGERSTRLFNLTKKLIKDDLLESLYNEISDGTLLSAVEVYFVAEAFRKTAEKISQASSDTSTPNISTVVSVMSAVLKSGKSVIKAADDSYGTSKILLESALGLIVGAASPMPVPVSSQQFSAFASKAGTGIQGFAYIPSKSKKSSGRMVTFDRNNSINRVLARRPSVLCYLNNQTEEYSIISTLFEDDSLFSAAEYPTMKLEGPVFGMKLFQKGGEDLDEARPIALMTRFHHSSVKNYGMQCVSWELTRIGGWSNSCTLFYSSSSFTVCLCIVLTARDMFFTIVRDDTPDEPNKLLLKLLPMKSNNGALLTIFRAELNKSFMQDLDRAMSCLISWGSDDFNLTQTAVSNERTELTPIGNITYSDDQKMLFFSISSNKEGYLQCKDNLGLGLISDRILLSIPNSASVVFSGQEFNHQMRNVHDFFETKYANFNFSTLSVADVSGGVIIRITRMSETNHFDFINELSVFSYNLSHMYGLPSPVIRSNHFCLQHDDGGFTWPTIKPGHSATPINPCINEFGAPGPARKCIGSYAMGVYWDASPPHPGPCEQPSQRAKRLKNLSNNAIEKDIIKELADSLKDVVNITLVETNHLRKALKTLAKEVSRPNSEISKPNITSVATIVNAFIEVENKIKSNTEDIKADVSSDSLLDSIDKLLEKASTSTATPVITSHFSAAAVSPGTTIKGFITNGNDITPVSDNSTIVDVVAKAPQVGAILLYAPEKVGLTYTNFQDSTLFVRANGTEDTRVASPIIGLDTFGQEEEASSKSNMTVLIVFSQDKVGKHRECHYWDTERSEWSREGCARVPSCDLSPGISEGMDACLCTHLTHFAMLVSDVDEFLSEDYVLHMLTLVGCSISLFALCGVFIIGIAYPEWRRGASKKVQLNLSASLSLLMAVYLAIASQGECPKSRELCIALGALLHYSVLASFSWMLVVAFLQLMRLTRTIALTARKQMGTHLLCRASVLGWGIPALLVSITLANGTDLYVRRPNSALCYPSGRAFYAGILFPVSLVIMMNTFIFSWLMRSLFCSKVQGMRVHQKDQRLRALRRLYAAMFLFCLLGISWVSGIAIELISVSETAVKVLSYVFCITATMQGTSLFIFFVACERKFGEKLSRATSIFGRKGSNIDTKVRYMAKTDGSTSEKATDSTTMTISDRNNSVRKNSSQQPQEELSK